MIDFCGIELRAPGHQRARAPSTRSPRGARSATRCSSDFPFAAFVSKTVTLEPRQGNPPPRLWEHAGRADQLDRPAQQGPATASSSTTCRQLAELPVPLIVNVMGFDREEVGRLVEAFAERDEVAALELNVSCPNVETGLIIGADPAETGGAARRTCARSPPSR